ncbi:MAG: tRNA preQ1(34) S-adenosylmethionine ribosyltransferase-isomerase QueA [Thermodesulfobacteriota bacterium]
MNDLRLASYDYHLPEELIAQQPASRRDASRLMLLDRATGHVTDCTFADFPGICRPGDLVVCNNTRVFPARLVGRKQSGGKVEIFLLEYPQRVQSGARAGKETEVVAAALLKSSKKMKPGGQFSIAPDFHGSVEAFSENGQAVIRLFCGGEPAEFIDRHGHVPLPPYIRRSTGDTDGDRHRYQTVYASQTGAVAAPTAGFHFTEGILSALERKGVGRAEITLHVGYGTFAPVRCEDIRHHPIHSEFVTVTTATAGRINATLAAGGRIWCIGTTTARALEFCADENGQAQPTADWCAIYIYPGYRFKLVRNLLTNFHLPKSSLLFLVSALAGREQVLAAYRQAVALGYRFYSYGDAMLITDSAAIAAALRPT